MRLGAFYTNLVNMVYYDGGADSISPLDGWGEGVRARISHISYVF